LASLNRGVSKLVLAIALGAAGCGGSDGGSGGSDDGADDDGDGDIDGDDGDLDQPPLTDGLATLAGFSMSGDVDGARTKALFNNPVNVVVGGGDQIFVADFDNSKIRRVDSDGDVVTASTTPLEGLFVRPFGMCLEGDTLYIQTDGDSMGTSGGALWRMNLGDGTPELLLDSAGRVRGMAALPDGRIALADYQDHILRLYDPGSGSVTLLAGAQGLPGFQDGSGTDARFNVPYDIAVTDGGDLLVSDWGNNRIRLVTLSGEVSTWAGTGSAGEGNGDRASATFDAPQGLAMDEGGNLYVSDTGNFVVRKISSSGEVSTIAGTGSPGYQDSEDPMSGQVFGLEGIDVTAGYLFIADGNRGETGPYHRIRRLTLD
jgi:sugar lactone lactonase YvrE